MLLHFFRGIYSNAFTVKKNVNITETALTKNDFLLQLDTLLCLFRFVRASVCVCACVYVRVSVCVCTCERVCMYV